MVKNKLAPPFREAEFDIMYGEGISREGELLDLAVKADVVQKAGAWFSYDGKRLGQGRDKVKELLKTDTELAKEIEEKLWLISTSSTTAKSLLQRQKLPKCLRLNRRERSLPKARRQKLT